MEKGSFYGKTMPVNLEFQNGDGFARWRASTSYCKVLREVPCLPMYNIVIATVFILQSKCCTTNMVCDVWKL